MNDQPWGNKGRTKGKMDVQEERSNKAVYGKDITTKAWTEKATQIKGCLGRARQKGKLVGAHK